MGVSMTFVKSHKEITLVVSTLKESGDGFWNNTQKIATSACFCVIKHCSKPPWGIKNMSKGIWKSELQ